MILAGLAVLTAYYLWGRTSEPSQPVLSSSLPPSSTNSAPPFTLSDISNRSVSLSDFKGKVVILDFWATWCPPCKREIPDFVLLQSQYGSAGLQVIGIGLDEPSKLQAFAQQNAMNYPILVGTEEVVARYGGIEGIPTTFVIDQSGVIRQKFEGYRPRQVFEEEIKRLLK
jgi:peroxiredoxin